MTALRFVALILVLYGGYNIWIAVAFGLPLFLIWTAMCLLAAYGAWRQKPWSRWLVYLVTVLTIVGVLSNIALLAFSAWPYSWPLESFTVLTPALLAVALCGWMFFVTHRFFRKTEKAVN